MRLGFFLSGVILFITAFGAELTVMPVKPAEAGSLCIGALCVNTSKPRRRVKTRKRRPSRPAPPAIPSQPRWNTGLLEDRMYASNNFGLAVSYDDAGDLILRIDIKTPIPDNLPNSQVPVTLDFGRYGNFVAIGIINQSTRTLIVSGPVVYSVVGGLKKGRRAKVTFLYNKFSVQLKGSGAAVGQIETAANQWKLLRKDKIDDARKAAAEDDIAKRPQSKVDTLQVADDTNKGVRPKPKLRDGPRKVSDIRVQYFVPGTRAIGEMWVNWDVDDDGLFVALNFIDPTHKYEKKSHTIRMPFRKGIPACELDLKKKPEVIVVDCSFTRALLKAQSWEQALEKKNYRKPVIKTIDYIVGSKQQQKSLSVIFRRYEDGGYAVQIDDRKFGVSKLFNFTIANGLDLARLIQDAVKEANDGVISEGDLDDILK